MTEFHMSDVMTGMLAAAVPLGGILGALVSGAFVSGRGSHWIGRRFLLLWVGIVYGLAGVGIVFAADAECVMMARLLLGFAIGAGALVTPLFISETAPPHIRGRLLTVFQLAITVGILVAYCMNYLLLDVGSWRLMYATILLPAVILLVGVFYLPESPRWLVLTGHIGLAEKTLFQLRGHASPLAVHQELDEIALTLRSEKPVRFSELFGARYRAVVWVGMGLFVFQQFSGINVVIYYAPIIFKAVGLGSLSMQSLATVVVGLVNVLSTIVAMIYIERVGRYRLLKFGFIGTACSLGMIWVGSVFQVAALSWLAFIGVLLFIISFAVSIGPLPYVMMAEIFPMHIRGAGMALSSLCNWGFHALIVFIFPVVSAVIGIPNTLGVFAGICLLGLLFTVYCVPETQGLSLEAIEEHVNSGRPLKLLGATSVTV
jgi:sugar porter (SP) family MFS transporter